MNTFGTKFRISIFGESHGDVIGVTIDGVRPGMLLSESDFKGDVERRRSGGRGTTPRRELDRPKIISGLFEGHTTGAPLTIVFENSNIRSKDYDNLTSHPRPSHADYTAHIKYRGYNDYRGGGLFSGRMTLALVAAGVVAKRMLGDGVKIHSEILELGGESDKNLHPQLIEKTLEQGDSIGGVIECRVEGVPVGWGEPFFDSVESVIAHLMFSIPAIKGVEFGSGFGAAQMRGSKHNDPIISAKGETATNHAGGINGGITNGNPLIVRVAVKPTSSISKEQLTYDFEKGEVAPLKIEGRHDACIALRVPVVTEAAVAIALAQFIE